MNYNIYWFNKLVHKIMHTFKKYFIFCLKYICLINIKISFRHYSVPYIPDTLDFKTFEGLLIHSHDYRDNTKFKDLKVVVLGAGASGTDIALEVAAVANEVSIFLFSIITEWVLKQYWTKVYSCFVRRTGNIVTSLIIKIES